MNSLEALVPRLLHLKTKRVGLALGLIGGPGIGKSFTARGAIKAAQIAHLEVHATISSPALARAWLGAFDERTKQRLAPWVVALLERLQCDDAVPLEGVVQFCATLLGQLAPFVLLVEDAHEASETQLLLWQELAKRLPKGASLLLTSRNPLTESFQSVALETLTEAETKALFESVASEGLPPETCRWIFERARGNPLFSLEYLRDLRRRGALTWRGADWQWSPPALEQLPNTIEAMIEHVLESVQDPSARTALEARALLADDDLALWSLAADLSATDLKRKKRDLEQLGVLQGAQFAHPLFREVAFKRSSNHGRTLVVTRLFEHLEHDDPLCAVRFAPQANVSATRVFKVFEKAIAASTDTNRKALLEIQALEFCPLEQRFERAFRAAKDISDFNLPEAERLLEIALAIKPDDLEAINVRARLWATQGDVERGRASLKAAMPVDGADAVRWWLHWHSFLIMISEVTAAAKVYEDHPEIHEVMSVGGQCSLAHDMVAQGHYQLAQERLNLLRQRPNLTELDRIKILNVEVVLASGQNHNQLALKLAIEVCELYQTSIGDLHSMNWITLLTNRASAYYAASQFAAAQRDYEQALRLWLESGYALKAAVTRALLGTALTDQGLYAEAEHALLEARSALDPNRAEQFIIVSEYKLARLYLIWRPPNGRILALKHARAAAKLARDLTMRTYRISSLFWLILCELEFGPLEAIPDLLLELEELTQSDSEVYRWHWASGVYQERLGKLESARQHLGEAIRLRADNVDSDYHWLNFELHRVNRDLPAVRATIEGFRANGFMPGVTLALRSFPELGTTPLTSPAIGGATEPITPALRINALGSLQVVMNGDALPLRGAKRKHLAALLLEAQLGGRDECKHTDLADALYPNATDEEARAAIKQLIFQWRAQFGAQCIITTANGYAFQNVISDAQIFLETGEVALWRGAYLEDVEDRDARALETVREALYGQLKQRAKALVADNAPEAARLAKILLETEPYDADALAIALRALQAQGSYTSISRMYKRSRATWLEVGERLPERWREFLGAEFLGAA
jgi:DNA-binding SARP family transcriptional activator